MSIPKEHVIKLCTSKHKYSSKKDGEFRIKAARKKGRIISPTLQVYKCCFCWAWHIGHRHVYDSDYKVTKKLKLSLT